LACATVPEGKLEEMALKINSNQVGLASLLKEGNKVHTDFGVD
jgi:hypothetical protein